MRVHVPKVFVHKKKAHSHEATLESLKTQAANLRSRVEADRDKATNAITVLTDQVSRLNDVSKQLRGIGV